jgi:hypothetical protein
MACATTDTTPLDRHSSTVFTRQILVHCLSRTETTYTDSDVGTFLRVKFGPKTDEMTGGWRKLHNEELHGLYSSPSIVRVIKARRMTFAGHVARMGDVRGAYNILVGRPEGRRPLGRFRRR